MSIGSRLNRLERSTADGRLHIVVVNSDGDLVGARSRYEIDGQTIRSGDSVTFVHTRIDRDPEEVATA